MPIQSFQPVDLTNYKPKKSTIKALNQQPNSPNPKPNTPAPSTLRQPLSRFDQSTNRPSPTKPPKPNKSSNSLIPDFGSTDLVYNDFYKSDFGYRLRKELKDKGFSSAQTRDELAGLIKDKSNRGLNRKEVRQGLDKLVQSGKITGSQAKYFRKISKIY
jgi:hypothetical protein